MSFVLLAVFAAAGRYLWFNSDHQTRSAFFAGQTAAAPEVASGEETVSLRDFQSCQQQSADALRLAAQDIAVQKADLKSLSDQVTALSAKIDAMQDAAKPTGSLPVEVRPGSQPPAIPAQASVVRARKKLMAPKTNRPISVRGAPLPPAPPADR